MHSNNGFSGAAAPAIPMITPADQSAAGRKALPAPFAEQSVKIMNTKEASSGFSSSFSGGNEGALHSTAEIMKNGLRADDKELIEKLRRSLVPFILKGVK